MSIALTMTTVPRYYESTLKTHALTKAVNSIYNPNSQCHECASQIVEVFVATIQYGWRLLKNLKLSGTFIFKVIEIRSHQVFRQGRVSLPCPCWFDKLICDILHILKLNTLTQSIWPLTTSILEHHYIQRRSPNGIVSMLDDLQRHVHASCFYLSDIRFCQSLDEYASDIVLSYDNDTWIIGSICRAICDGTYYDAKIVWISRFRRTCRIVYSNWNGWGWEATQYSVLLKNIVMHERDCPQICPSCDKYDNIICDRYI